MPSDPSPVPGPGHMPFTTWNCIRRAGDPTDPGHARALEQFAQAYWRPVFCFLRAHGHAPDKAEDLTQAFFARCLERGWLQTADPEKGKFRNFLLTLLTRFVCDDGPRAKRQERFERRVVSLDRLRGDEERGYEPPTNETPETVFMRQWFRSALAKVLQDLGEFCDTPERRAGYEALLAGQFAQRSAKHRSQSDIARTHGLTRDQVRTARGVVRKRFDRLLRAEVRGQVCSEAEFDEEVRELLTLFGG